MFSFNIVWEILGLLLLLRRECRGRMGQERKLNLAVFPAQGRLQPSRMGLWSMDHTGEASSPGGREAGPVSSLPPAAGRECGQAW